jgi:hypothetical protein
MGFYRFQNKIVGIHESDAGHKVALGKVGLIIQ